MQTGIPAEPADPGSVQPAGTCMGAEQDPEEVRSTVVFQLLDPAAIIIKEEIGLAELKH